MQVRGPCARTPRSLEDDHVVDDALLHLLRPQLQVGVARKAHAHPLGPVVLEVAGLPQAEWLAGRQHAAQFLELAFGAVTKNKRRARRARELLRRALVRTDLWGGVCMQTVGGGWGGHVQAHNLQATNMEKGKSSFWSHI